MAVVGFVLLAILALLLLLLCIPIVGSARFDSDAPGEAYVQWLFYRRWLLGRKKPPRPKKKQEQPPKQAPVAPAGKEKKDLSAAIGTAMDFIASLGSGAKMLLRRVCIYHVHLRVVVAEDDAAQTAIAFGRMNALVYTAYTAARGLFHLKKPDILITPDFMAQEGSWQFEARGRLLPIAAVAAAVRIGAAFLVKTVKRQAVREKVKARREQVFQPKAGTGARGR
ncbi:DUF2953 domain-containing protein [Anaerotruncus sp.]|uniref:DUF2953 domain-containing protein n=1 Tax=Anaerotruncus TaxID=244127 RepID=UPI00216D52C7|nr:MULTISPECIES: DUF2953 domain-containing protein [Anaerotruncus]MCI8492029.1 DUF2953 domain-containing protein [Anaerotruncus sp.]